MSMENGSGNRAQWLAGILFGVIFTAISWLCNAVNKHEGNIGNLEGQLGVIQRGLERLETKIDDLRGRK